MEAVEAGEDAVPEWVRDRFSFLAATPERERFMRAFTLGLRDRERERCEVLNARGAAGLSMLHRLYVGAHLTPPLTPAAQPRTNLKLQ